MIPIRNREDGSAVRERSARRVHIFALVQDIPSPVYIRARDSPLDLQHVPHPFPAILAMSEDLCEAGVHFE